tara:strand:- start:2434 stop:3069 length:636 start_codon:yes stop_codon:yes gene_type:complete
MKNLILITQGSQAISLVRTLFGLGYKPNQLIVYTTKDNKNICFQEFLKYYNIDYSFKIDMNKICKGDIVISYSNMHKLDINNKAIFINFHPGILPNYKGSLSTVYSLANGENKVGGTWHYMSDKIDCGNILYEFIINIEDSDTAFSLNHKIFDAATNCLDIVLNKIKINDGGIQQTSKGKFYYNKFPDISNLDKNMQNRINYFPPEYINGI